MVRGAMVYKRLAKIEPSGFEPLPVHRAAFLSKALYSHSASFNFTNLCN